MPRKNVEISLAPRDIRFFHFRADHQAVRSNNLKQKSLIHVRFLQTIAPRRLALATASSMGPTM
jgi:hypothetical protein